MNYEKIRMKFWTEVYLATEGNQITKSDHDNQALDAFDETFDIDDMDMDVSVDDIIDVLRKAKHN